MKLKRLKRWQWIVVGVASFFLLTLGLSAVQERSIPTLRVNGAEFAAEIADNNATRQRGLSGRASFSEKSAMVFVFEKPERQCFWMKNMNFSIDMIWLDSAKQVVAIEHDVDPDTYPQTFCYDNAQYVVEFAAGVAQKIDLKVGDTLTY